MGAMLPTRAGTARGCATNRPDVQTGTAMSTRGAGRGASLQQLLRQRRMVRGYRDEPVDADALRRVLDAARRGPTAGNAQGIDLVLVTSQAGRRALATAAGEAAHVAAGRAPWISSAPVVVVPCADEHRYRDRYAEPDKATATPPEQWPVPYWHLDLGAALVLLLLAAVDEGLAAGFLGAHAVDGLAGLLGLPRGVHPAGLVTLGHEAAHRPAPTRSARRPRRALDEVVHVERW